MLSQSLSHLPFTPPGKKPVQLQTSCNSRLCLQFLWHTIQTPQLSSCTSCQTSHTAAYLVWVLGRLSLLWAESHWDPHSCFAENELISLVAASYVKSPGHYFIAICNNFECSRVTFAGSEETLRSCPMQYLGGDQCLNGKNVKLDNVCKNRWAVRVSWSCIFTTLLCSPNKYKEIRIALR